MDIKVVASILSSLVVGCLVYFFNDSLFTGISPFLFAAYLVVILAITTSDVFLIIRQKVQSRKVVMIVLLILSLLTSIVLSHIYIKKEANAAPRQYVEP